MTGSIIAEGLLTGVPNSLRAPLIEEFTKLVTHYRESRWEPAELNGGKLCEIVYTILKGYVEGTYPDSPSKPRNMVAACNALEQATAAPRAIRIQIPRILIALYEIRNNRNVGHVGADVDPNHMDATVVISMCQWIMAELIRVFHAVTTEQATAAVDAIVERKVPLLWHVNGKTRILASGLSAKDKMLLLLYGSTGSLAVSYVVKSIEYTNATQFKNKVASPAHKANLIEFDMSGWTLTISPLGIRYVEENLPLTL
ncbi:hypothetical protein [uncultured Sphingomonas sp.]|uniref:hypothetical protein n=1 Tax=uncultured Sphingomonas sp. TaxID=158754 RepID=UPI002600C6D9|nr:hypothetical protein [uncultured Sphingomonas sp.]